MWDVPPAEKGEGQMMVAVAIYDYGLIYLCLLDGCNRIFFFMNRSQGIPSIHALYVCMLCMYVMYVCVCMSH